MVHTEDPWQKLLSLSIMFLDLNLEQLSLGTLQVTTPAKKMGTWPFYAIVMFDYRVN
jgi:hypothetical protein